MDKTKIKYSTKLLILAFVCCLCIPLARLSHLGDSYYKTIYYGTLVPTFNYSIQAIIYAILIAVMFTLTIKLTGFKPIKIKEKAEPLPMKNMLILLALTIIPILIISGCIHWNIKPIYDLGTYFTGLELKIELINILKTSLMIILVYFIIALSQEALENLFPSKRLIPWGGIFATLTFGLYELIFKIHYLPWIYIFMGLIMGYIYLFSKKTFTKGYLLMLLVYLF